MLPVPFHGQSHVAPGAYEISDDKQRLDIAVVHGYLTRSYWSPGIPRAVVERAIENSLCFGIYACSLQLDQAQEPAQIGFGRVITDKATFAYLADVFVLEAHRGQGLSKRLVATVLAHADLGGLRRFMLGTLDAHGLYRQFGFTELARPERVMEILRPGVYE